MPVMQYSDSRELRLRFYKAYLTRASELSETDGPPSPCRAKKERALG